MERMKEAGLVYYLIEKAGEARVKQRVREATVWAKEHSVENVENFSSPNFRVGLSDSILKESFAVLAYGMGMSLLVIAIELVRTHLYNGT